MRSIFWASPGRRKLQRNCLWQRRAEGRCQDWRGQPPTHSLCPWEELANEGATPVASLTLSVGQEALDDVYGNALSF